MVMAAVVYSRQLAHAGARRPLRFAVQDQRQELSTLVISNGRNVNGERSASARR
jgi:hypothetical protein